MRNRLVDRVPMRFRPYIAKKFIRAYQRLHTNPDGSVLPYSHEEIRNMYLIARWSEGDRSCVRTSTR